MDVFKSNLLQSIEQQKKAYKLLSVVDSVGRADVWGYIRGLESALDLYDKMEHPAGNAELEIAKDRGVIYVHSVVSGATLVRICGLPIPVPDPEETSLLDITIGKDKKAVFNWRKRPGNK